MNLALIGQIPNATPDQLNGWLLGLAAIGGILLIILGIAKHARDLFWPSTPVQMVPPTPTYAQAAELHELRRYTQQSVHELRDSLHALQLRLEAVHREIGKEIESAISRLEVKVDRYGEILARLAALSERPVTAITRTKVEETP